MRRRSIVVDGLHHGTQPFPVACLVDQLLQTSALHAMRPADGSFADSAAEQVRQVFDNARLVLQAASADFDDVVYVEVLAGAEDVREEVNHLWISTFPDPDSRPARHTTVAPLREPLLVQLRLTAYLPKDHP